VKKEQLQALYLTYGGEKKGAKSRVSLMIQRVEDDDECFGYIKEKRKSFRGIVKQGFVMKGGEGTASCHRAYKQGRGGIKTKKGTPRERGIRGGLRKRSEEKRGGSGTERGTLVPLPLLNYR